MIFEIKKEDDKIDTKELKNLLVDSKSIFRDGKMFLNLDNDKYMVDVSLDDDSEFVCNVWGQEIEKNLTPEQKQVIYDHLTILLKKEIEEQRIIEKDYESEDHNLFI